ncbi:MAG: hypothetical protein WDA17_05695 [Sphaerochaetaceae bacterium]
MDFSEKINLLIKLTSSTNSKLAKEISVDPSLISRWRTGDRVPKANSHYISKLSSFFSSKAQTEYQKRTLLELISYPKAELNNSNEEIASYLNKWLRGEPKVAINDLANLLNHIGENLPSNDDILRQIEIPELEDGTRIDTICYKGKKGIQSATLKLLLKGLENPKKNHLLIYSNQSIEWLIEDIEYARLWTSLFKECICRGMKVTIIHCINRQSGNLSDAIRLWIPIYASGALSSYYYPRKRDNFFNCTTVVLDKQCCLTSSSIAGQNEDEIRYYYTTNSDLVNSAKEKFLIQLSHCDSLIKTFANKKTKAIFDEYDSFFRGDSTWALGLQSLLLLTMNPTLLSCVFERLKISEDEKRELINQQKIRYETFKQNLKIRNFTFVISLPRLSEILKSNTINIVAQLLFQNPITYEPKEFLDHLTEISNLTKEYENLKLVIIPNKQLLVSLPIFGMHDSSLVVLKHHTPRMVFISEQKELSNALIAFIQAHCKELPKREQHIKYNHDKLSNYVQRLKIALI